MSLPALTLIGALLGYPILQAIYYSMTTWDGLTTTWIGPSTYTTALKDPTFWRVAETTRCYCSRSRSRSIPLAIAARFAERST